MSEAPGGWATGSLPASSVVRPRGTRRGAGSVITGGRRGLGGGLGFYRGSGGVSRWSGVLSAPQSCDPGGLSKRSPRAGLSAITSGVSRSLSAPSSPPLATRLLAHKIQSPQEWEAIQALTVRGGGAGRGLGRGVPPVVPEERGKLWVSGKLCSESPGVGEGLKMAMQEWRSCEAVSVSSHSTPGWLRCTRDVQFHGPVSHLCKDLTPNSKSFSPPFGRVI